MIKSKHKPQKSKHDEKRIKWGFLVLHYSINLCIFSIKANTEVTNFHRILYQIDITKKLVKGFMSVNFFSDIRSGVPHNFFRSDTVRTC